MTATLNFALLTQWKNFRDVFKIFSYTKGLSRSLGCRVHTVTDDKQTLFKQIILPRRELKTDIFGETLDIDFLTHRII